MKYCFLLPAYKARFFEEALGSILAQIYKVFDVIVSDDCSPEDLKSIVDKFADPRVTYRRNEINIGAEHLVDHWNMLLALTNAEYIIMASDDDIYDPRYLEEMNKLAERYHDANVLRPMIRMINANGEEIIREIYPGNLLTTEKFIDLWASGKLCSGIPYYVFRRETLLKLGGFHYFPYATYSDDATVIENSRNGIAVAEEVLFSFRYSAYSISGSFSKELVEGKINAARQFNKDVLNQLQIDYKILNIARNRIRRLMRTDVSSCRYGKIWTMLKLLFYPSENLLTLGIKARIVMDILIRM